MRRARLATLIALSSLAGIQLVPVDRSNPPPDGEVPASSEVRAILRRACYDCHSNETRWPWYGYVAPMSWLLRYDVKHARGHLNFTSWNRYDQKERRENIHEAWEEVEEGEMPLWIYRPLHPEARLSEADKRLLRAWSEREGGAEDDSDDSGRNSRHDHDHDDDD